MPSWVRFWSLEGLYCLHNWSKRALFFENYLKSTLCLAFFYISLQWPISLIFHFPRETGNYNEFSVEMNEIAALTSAKQHFWNCFIYIYGKILSALQSHVGIFINYNIWNWNYYFSIHVCHKQVSYWIWKSVFHHNSYVVILLANHEHSKLFQNIMVILGQFYIKLSISFKIELPNSGR